MSLGLSAATWVSLGGAALGAMGGSGGGATQTADRSPWLEAQPWMKQNIGFGQDLQKQYQAQPFNQGQMQAYGNMGATSDYVRNQIPSLLGTINQMGGGFDRNNVNARPQAFQFGGMGGNSNLGLGPSFGSSGSALQSSLAGATAAAPPAAAPAAQSGPTPGSPEWYAMMGWSYDAGDRAGGASA